MSHTPNDWPRFASGVIYVALALASFMLRKESDHMRKPPAPDRSSPLPFILTACVVWFILLILPWLSNHLPGRVIQPLPDRWLYSAMVLVALAGIVVICWGEKGKDAEGRYHGD